MGLTESTVLRPIDVAAKEKEVEERLEQERQVRAATTAAAVKEKESSSPFGSRSSFSRAPPGPKGGPTSPSTAESSANTPPDIKADKTPAPRREFTAGSGVVKPQFSFAAAAAAKEAAAKGSSEAQAEASASSMAKSEDSVEKLANDVASTL